MKSRDSVLPCEEVSELVTDYLEGALPERRRIRFEDHMSTCKGCETFARQIEEIVAVLRLLPRGTSPPLDDRLLAALRRRRLGQRLGE